MPTPTFVAVSNGSTGSSTSVKQFTIAQPSGLANGDLVLIYVSMAMQGAGQVAVTAPGFTSLTPAYWAGQETTLLYRWVDGTETWPITVSWPTTNLVAAGVAYAARNVSAFDPAPTSGAVSGNTGNSTVTAPSITTTHNGDLLVWLGGYYNSAATTLTVPSGYTKRGSQSDSTASNRAGVLSGDTTQATAGATGAVVGSATGNPGTGAVLVGLYSNPPTTATGSGTMVLSGTGTGVAQIVVPATGNGSITLSGAGVATVSTVGIGSGAMSFSGSGTASITAQGTTPQVASTGYVGTGPPGGPLTVGVPDGVQPSSLVVCYVTSTYSVAGTPPPTADCWTPPDPSWQLGGFNWSQVFSTQLQTAAWYYKYATAADTGTYVWGANPVNGGQAIGMKGVASRIVDGPPFGNPFTDPFRYAGHAGTSATTLTVPTFTPSQGSALLLAGTYVNSSTAMPIGYPPGWTVDTPNASADQSDSGHLAMSTAAPTGDLIFTLSASARMVALIGTIFGATLAPGETEGWGEIAFGGTGTAALTLFDTGSGAMIFYGSGQATVTVPATGSGAITLSGSGLPKVTLRTSGVGTLTLTGLGTATFGTGALGKPVPPGRGRWRLTLHKRYFNDSVYDYTSTMIAELTDARGRRLTQQLNSPAELTFTLDGESSQAPLVQELACDVIAWRWDEVYGDERPIFLGTVDHSEDQMTGDTTTVTFVCHDHLALLQRRILTSTWTGTQMDQDYVVAQLFARATSGAQSSSSTVFTPGSVLPAVVTNTQPGGQSRGTLSGQLRDRTYPAQTIIGQAIDDLAHVINGFDYDILPMGGLHAAGRPNLLRIFYPQQGVTRTDMVLMYGATLDGLTRTVASGDYANYVRVLGNNQSSDASAAQLFSETWNTEATSTTPTVGLWMQADAASDVTVQSDLDGRAGGDLARNGVIVPTYTVTMRPGVYRYGFPNMGDVVPLIVNKGRLNVNTTERIMGITYDIDDDGQENIELALGRPVIDFVDILNGFDEDIKALSRR